MGDTDNPRHEPPISSGGGDSSEEDPEDHDIQPTGLDDHTPDAEAEETEESEESTGTPGGTVVGGTSGGVAGTSTPTGTEPPSEEADDEEESESPEQPEPDQPDEEPDQEEDSDDDEQEDEDDDDEEEEQEAQIVVHSDSWDSIGWGIYPVRLQLKEEYGDQVQFDDQLVPVRDFDSPEERKQYWEKWSPRHGMPVNTNILNDDPPESTEFANRAFAAAREQSIPLARRFMRRLRIAAIVEGTNIEDRDTLFDLARNVGLDTDQLAADWDDVHVRTSIRDVETPKTTIHVDGQVIQQPGLVTINDLKTPLKRAGLKAEDPQNLYGFVDDHGPVALKEVIQVYDHNEEEALDELRSTEGVQPVEFGDATLWTTM